jgi:hypothetical protein
MYICLRHHCKGISKEIEFRCHIGKILTLSHNQSNVCYVRDEGRKRLFGYKVQIYIYVRVCMYIYIERIIKKESKKKSSLFSLSLLLYSITYDLLFDVLYIIEY